MSVILKKEKVQTGEVVCQKYSQTTIDCDVIVPDINPDISKIMDVSGFISIKEKTLRSNKLYIQGTVTMTALYSPEGEVLNKAKALWVCQEFSHSVDVGNTDGDITPFIEVEPENFAYSLINSRKVNLRCTAGINIKLTRADELELVTGIDAGTDICIDNRTIRLCNSAITSENRLNICEQIELPSDKPTIGEILKTTIFPQSVEFTLMENKALAKGQIRICVLYTSLDDGTVNFTEHSLPFSEVLDVMGAEEDMEGEIDYAVSDIYCEAREDSDGELRILGLDIGLCATIKGLSLYEPTILRDAYSLNGTVKLSCQDRVIEQLVDSTTAQLTHKASVSPPEHLPEISRICHISATAAVDRISAEGNEITLFGHLKYNVLYITDAKDLPIGSFTNISEFSHTIHISDSADHAVCDARVFVEHISFTISSGSTIDLRTVLGLNVRSFKNETVCHITDVEITEDTEACPKPNIVMYFVQEGDTLWSIAKRYQTTVDNLKECNSLTDDTIITGQILRICRKAA